MMTLRVPFLQNEGRARGRRAQTRASCRLTSSLLPALLGVLLATGGCRGAVLGDWRLEQATPSREVFALDDVRFERNGGFSATCTLDGRTTRETGTYEFNGFQLTLRPQAGGQRQYNAQLQMRKLELSDSQKRRVTLRKVRS